MPQALRPLTLPLLLALLAVAGVGLAGRSQLLAAPLPPGERSVAARSGLRARASSALDGAAGRMGLACGSSEVFVWDGSGMNEAAAWLEARSFDAGMIYREQHRDVDSILFRAFLDSGERLALWVRLDGATLLAVCTV
jgi:hypothetical protein